MLLSLLLANIKILSCFFFLFLVVLSNFFTILVVREKIKVKLALTIPTGAPTTLKQKNRYSSVVALKIIKILSIYLLTFLLHDLLWLIYSWKWFSILLISSTRNFVCSDKSVLSMNSIELLLFIFEIRQNYIIIFLKIIWRKKASIISQFFTRKHKTD